MPLEKRNDPAEDAVVTADHQAQNKRQITEKPEVRAQLQQIRPPHTAENDEIPAAGLAERAQHAANLAQTDPCMRMRFDAGFSFAHDGDEMHIPALSANRIGDLKRQVAVAGQDSQRAKARVHVQPSEWRGVHKDLLPPSRMKATISCTRGWLSNSAATSSRRSFNVPSAANSNR